MHIQGRVIKDARVHDPSGGLTLIPLDPSRSGTYCGIPYSKNKSVRSPLKLCRISKEGIIFFTNDLHKEALDINIYSLFG